MVGDKGEWQLWVETSARSDSPREIARAIGKSHSTLMRKYKEPDVEYTRQIPLLAEVARTIRDAPAGWLFPNGKGTHLTPAHVGKLVRRALEGEATAHQLRHRFATRTYQATRDIRAVQELLGHASVATTQRYTKVTDDALRAVLMTAV